MNDKATEPAFFSIDRIEDVQNIIDQNAPDISSTLIIFDIDLTLTSANDPASYLIGKEPYQSIFKKRIASLSPLVLDRTFLFGIVTGEQHLLDEKSIDIVLDLQRKGFKVMGFTALLSGDVDELGNIESWRSQVLDNFGINFRHVFPIERKVLDFFPLHNGNYPVYHEGILYANGEGKKGTVLVNFLHEVDTLPKTIVVIEDRKDNLMDIENAISKWNPDVRFIGIEYLANKIRINSQELSEKAFLSFWNGIIAKAQKGVVLD